MYNVVVFIKMTGPLYKRKTNYLIWSSEGAERSSEVERSLMVRWVVGSILHGVDPLSYFSFQSVLHDWCNNGRGMMIFFISSINEDFLHQYQITNT